MAEKSYHVTYNKAQGCWQVKAAGAERASFTSPTKPEAIARAKQIARNSDATLYVHNMNGQIARA
ncbi:MAG: DUF2188 domain-containing protein [Rickettsiales bacterium]|jgi:hypothetical protein|nr:DUF2188 domain-containing protein [Rickettsiales bacterium]